MKQILVLATMVIFMGGYFVYRTLQDPTRSGQAGMAYTENASGDLEEVDSDRAVVANTNSEFAKRDISAFNEMRRQADEKEYSEEKWVRKFDLIERSGKRVQSDDLKGQPYVAGFFFTLCPTICPKQNEKVQQLQTRFKGQPIRLLSISCDPEVDTPAKLSAYAKRFDADESQWLFLTGEMEHISRVGGEMFSLAVTRRGHAEKFVLVDAEGDIVGFYAWADPTQWLALQADIEELLKFDGVFPNKPE